VFDVHDAWVVFVLGVAFDESTVELDYQGEREFLAGGIVEATGCLDELRVCQSGVNSMNCRVFSP
jgi:hypothetical protein